jgi:periplasmic nitrate reductase NapD
MRTYTSMRRLNDAVQNDAHIAGIILHGSSDKIDAIQRAISLIPGARIHAVSAAGKLVLTLQAESSVEVIEQFQAIHDLPGVYFAAIVFQNASLDPVPHAQQAGCRAMGR